MTKKRDLGAEILEGLRHIKSGGPVRVTTWTSVSGIRGQARMHNPPHPGETLRSLCLEPLGLSVTEAAAGLGVDRKTLSAILNGRAGIGAEMAVRLSIAFKTSAESWLHQQLQYDLWRAEKLRKTLRVARLTL